MTSVGPENSLLNPSSPTAPFEGVVTRWRVKRAAWPPTRLALQILEPASPPLHKSTSAPVTPAVAGVHTFETRLPIARGDTYALAGSGAFVDVAGTALGHAYEPPLGEPGSRHVGAGAGG